MQMRDMNENEKQSATLLQELQKMAEVDIRTVDPDTLVDIDTVKVDTSLSDEERIIDYIRQIKNPYCYLSHGVVVKVSFAGRETLEECLSRCMKLA